MSNKVIINSNHPINVNIGTEQETSLKKMIICVTQTSTSAPVLELLENNSSLSFNNINNIIRLSEGSYEFYYQTTEIDLFDKLFVDISNKGMGFKNIKIYNAIEKGGVVQFAFSSFLLNNGTLERSDSIIEKNIITIYINE